MRVNRLFQQFAEITDYNMNETDYTTQLKIKNDRAMLQIVVQSAELYGYELHAELYVFMRVK